MRKALEIHRRYNRPDSDALATTLSQLGIIISDLNGSLPEAEAYSREAVQITEKANPGNHPAVLVAQNNLATVLYKAGKENEATAIFDNTRVKLRAIFGEQHPELVVSLTHQAAMLRDAGNLDEAERFFREALAMQKRISGPTHFAVAKVMQHTAQVLSSKHKPIEALALQRDALKLLRDLYGNDHQMVEEALNNMGILLLETKKFTEAEAVFREAIAIGKRIHLDDRADFGRVLSGLAWALDYQGRASEAESLDREALALVRRLQGESPLHAEYLHNLTLRLMRQGKLREAAPLQMECLALQEKLFGKESRVVAKDLEDYAYSYAQQGTLDKAEDLLRQALDIERKLAAGNPLGFMPTLVGYHDLLKQQRKLLAAETVAMEILEIRKQQVANPVISLESAVDLVVDDLRQQGKFSETEAVFSSLLNSTNQSPARLAAIYRARGFSRARHGQFESAADDLATALRYHPENHWNWYQLAPLMAKASDLPSFENLRRQMLIRFTHTNTVGIAERTAKACLLLPVSGEELTAARQCAEKATALATNSPLAAYYYLVGGLAKFRSGEFSAALDLLDLALAKPGVIERDVQALSVKAMSLRALGRAAEASTTFEDAMSLWNEKLKTPAKGDYGLGFHDWLIADILLREAQQSGTNQPPAGVGNK
jgi:tetratricopeptide (TPR) repeat protein